MLTKDFIICRLSPTTMILQETKSSFIDKRFIKLLWNSKNVGWSSLNVVGSLGGILILWNDPSFAILDAIEGAYTLSLHINLADDCSFLVIRY